MPEKRPSVYVETTVISYLTNRLSRDLVVAGHQQFTQDWWLSARQAYELYVSAAVVREISQGNEEAAFRRQQILKDVTILEAGEEVRELASSYVEQQIIPQKAFEDAVHLAVAVLTGIDYLVSWNCKHIVNPVIKGKIKDFNDSLGLKTPYICTPLELAT